MIAARIEPARFAMTGAGIAFGVRSEFWEDVHGGSLDAPEFIARGGLRLAAVQMQPASPYFVASEVRP